MDKTPIYIIDDVCRVVRVIPPILLKQFDMGEMEQTKDGQRYYVTEEQFAAFLEKTRIKAKQWACEVWTGPRNRHLG